MFSVDCAIGVIVFLVTSFCFHEPLTIEIFLFSIVMAHLPDFDLIPYLMIRKTMRIPSHWLVGHHPTIIVLLALNIAVFVGVIFNLNILYLATIAIIDVLLHFVHDSIQSQGLHWLSPFSWKRFTLQKGFPEKVTQMFWLRFAARARAARKNGPNTAFGEIEQRIK